MTAPSRPLSLAFGPSLRRLPGACGLALVLLAAPAGAQDSYTRSLMERVDRLQREVSQLQRQVYQGGIPTAAAATGGGDVSPTQAARLELRTQQIEAEMRRLTGLAEELSHRVGQLSDRLDEQVAGLSDRLDRLEAGGLAAAPAQTGADYGEVAPQQTFRQLPPAEDGEPAPLASEQPTAPGPRTLGTVAANDLEALRSQALALQRGEAAEQGAAQPAAPAGGQTAALPGDSAKEQYDHAFGLLSQANYPEAEQALKGFLARYPDDPLAGNAKYWLGETYYVRQQYKDAAVTFAEGFQQYPDSTKAPDNLLKLGKSLAALGQNQDACGTHAELLKRFPSAPSTILQQAESEQRRLGCQ